MFHLPITVPMNPAMRLVQNDSSYVTLADIYENYCKEAGIARDDPVFISGEKLKQTLRLYRQDNQNGAGQPTRQEYFVLKKDLFDDVQTNLVPDNIVTQVS